MAAPAGRSPKQPSHSRGLDEKTSACRTRPPQRAPVLAVERALCSQPTLLPHLGVGRASTRLATAWGVGATSVQNRVERASASANPLRTRTSRRLLARGGAASRLHAALTREGGGRGVGNARGFFVVQETKTRVPRRKHPPLSAHLHVQRGSVTRAAPAQPPRECGHTCTRCCTIALPFTSK